MTKITVSEFKGVAPKYHAEQLADGYSVESDNTRTGRGILEPWRKSASLLGGSLGNSGIQSMFKYTGGWFAWTDRGVKAVEVPLANDPYDFVAITGQGSYPLMTANIVAGALPNAPVAKPMGVPIPDAPTIYENDVLTWEVPVPEPGQDEYDLYDASYVIVIVDGWGRVGPASDPSPIVKLREYQGEQTVKITLELPTVIPRIVGLDGNMGRNAAIRVYRANYSDTGQGVYQYLGDANYGDQYFVDNFTASGDLGEAIATADWVGPPDDDLTTYPNGAMQNIISVASSFMAGHTKKAVCFSEPNAGHAWPVRYYHISTDNIVTISPMGSSVCVLTDAVPFVLDGVHPESMSATRLADPIPCVSKYAVAEVNDAVYFASKNGLYMIRGTSAEDVSRHFMTEPEWKALDPSTMVFANYDSRLIISCPSVGSCYALDTRDAADGLRKININPQAMAQLEVTNDLAYIESGASDISVFDDDDGQYMPLSWKSKVYRFNTPTFFSCAKVQANAYPANLKVTFKCELMDGSTGTYTKTVENDLFFYLPFGTQARRWWFEVSHNGGATRPEIRNIQLAQSPEELD